MKNIKQLHPRLQESIYQLQILCEKQGVPIRVTDCLRTVAEQDALYAQGRTKKGSIVTNAKGSTYSSMHQWGVAFDYCRCDGVKDVYYEKDGFFKKVGKIGKDIGLYWGGDFSSIYDPAHFQLPDWGEGPSNLKKQFGTPEKFFKYWEVEPMTINEKNEFNNLKNKVAQLSNNCENVYHYTMEVPEWGRPTIQKLLNKGLYAGASCDDLNLPENLLRVLVINDRAGLYD